MTPNLNSDMLQRRCRVLEQLPPGAMKRYGCFLVLLLLTGNLGATPAPFQVAQWLRPVPRHSVLAEPGYYVWGGSVVKDQGQYHIFYSRWTTNAGAFADGWLFASEIAHAVANDPGGPFVPTGVVLGRRTNDPNFAFWDSQTQHNPHLRRFGNKFYLYYMASVDPGTNAWPGVDQRNRIQRNQRIGVIAADSIQDLLNGNFVRPAAPIISPVYSTNAATDRTTNPADFAGNRIVNNQTVIERPDGKFQLIHKSNWPQSPNYGHGFALADDPAGPFTLVPGPVFSNQGREDENHWYDAAREKYFLLCKNFSGSGIEQLESNDSTNWVSRGVQFGKLIQWADGVTEAVEALERPQLLRDDDGEPLMLFMACRRALPNGSKESFNVHIPLRAPATQASVVNGPQDIKTNGVLVQALNLGATNSLVVNGITFAPSGTNAAQVASAYGFTQTGGVGGATLKSDLVDTVFDGVPAFERFLDTIAWQTGGVQAGAKLSFQLSGLTLGRRYRAQFLFGETRASLRHGPQTLTVGEETSPAFDYGPSSSLVVTGATVVKLETTLTATGSVQTVTLTQLLGGSGGLQIAAFVVHDISPPGNASITMPPGGNPTVSWQVVPGFTYAVQRSADFASWSPAPSGTYSPVGDSVLNLFYTDFSPPPLHAFYRLLQSE